MAEKLQNLMKKTAPVDKKEKRNQELVNEIISRGFIKEDEVLLIRMRMNKNWMSYDDTEPLNGIKITPEQTQKGLNWLMNEWKTPKGVERKNNPFGLREQDVLEHFKEFRLDSFTNNNNAFQAGAGINNWVPVWNVIATDGGGFQYYMEAGQAKIIG